MSVQLHDRSPVVERVQQRLIELGYTGIGHADGEFGLKTDAGVRYFQACQSIHVDGVVDDHTASVMGVDLHAEHPENGAHSQDHGQPNFSWSHEPYVRDGYVCYTVLNQGAPLHNIKDHVLFKDSSGNTMAQGELENIDYPTGVAQERSVPVSGIHHGTTYELWVIVNQGREHAHVWANNVTVE